MLKDKLLVLKCKHGSKDAMRQIYHKYKDYLLTLARALLHNKATAEDVVHDVFVNFAESIERFRLTGSLRGYLATCVANLARDRIRLRKHHANLDSKEPLVSSLNNPEEKIIEKEELARLRRATRQLPYEQREAVILHIKGGMKFREIAKLQGVSVNTIQGRYRYGLNKLRSLLNNEVMK
ncbi:MAG: RNA polymerase sigma factor [Planctomycetota bacterium]|jgi:RNA polymerase sigma-70 factor (ECF subfamily)